MHLAPKHKLQLSHSRCVRARPNCARRLRHRRSKGMQNNAHREAVCRNDKEAFVTPKVRFPHGRDPSLGCAWKTTTNLVWPRANARSQILRDRQQRLAVTRRYLQDDVIFQELLGPINDALPALVHRSQQAEPEQQRAERERTACTAPTAVAKSPCRRDAVGKGPKDRG